MLGGDLGLAAGELRELAEYLAHTCFPEIALAQGNGGARLSLGRAVAGRGGGASASEVWTSALRGRQTLGRGA